MKTTTFDQSTYPHYGPQQRIVLLVSAAAAGICAIAGGIGLLGNWIGMDKSYLKDTPFNSYLIPALLLMVVVGGALLTASYLAATYSKFALPASLAAGFMLLGWISIQIMLIGMVNWLQPMMGAAGGAIALLAVIYSRR